MVSSQSLMILSLFDPEYVRACSRRGCESIKSVAHTQYTLLRFVIVTHASVIGGTASLPAENIVQLTRATEGSTFNDGVVPLVAEEVGGAGELPDSKRRWR